MAVVPSTAPRIVPPSCVFPPSGRQLITLYLMSEALRGELSDAIIPGGCYVAAGVNVFSVRPDALPFKSSHRRRNGVVWGYFSAAKPAGDIQQAWGGYWVRYGPEKGYKMGGGETFGFRRRFVFQVKQTGADGRVRWADTQWRMKEYRLNKDTASVRRVLPDHPRANMDFVIRKVFMNPVAVAPPPPQQPTPSSKVAKRGGSRLPPREARPPLPPKTNMRGVVREAIAKPVDPPPLPARSSEEAGPVVSPPPPPVRSGEKGNPGSNDEDQARERAGCVVKPNGRHVIRHFLTPKALFGKLSEGTIPRYVAEGVNIFSEKPDALPFQPSQHGEVWGYFFADKPADDVRPASGGCWVRYGPEKEYANRGKAVAFRRRFAFHAEWRDGDGEVRREETRWRMKEYRFNREHAVFRRAPPSPKVNLDCVIYKIFLQPMVLPPPPSARSSEERPGTNSNNPIVVDEAGPAAYHRAKTDRPKNLVGFGAVTKPVVPPPPPPPPPPPAPSSEEENPGSNCPSVDEKANCSNGEDQAKAYRPNKDEVVFPRVQPNPNLVGNKGCLVRPPPPPLDLELRLGPPGSYSSNPSIAENQARWSARSRVEAETRPRPRNHD